MKTPVTIIIIAHSNATTLSRALISIEKNARPIDQKILVLNAASSEVVQIADQLSSDWLVAIENEEIGPQHARNKGAQFAQQEFIVFLDDDIGLHPLWIDHMLSRFTHQRIAIGQGHIQFEKKPGLFWNYLRYKNAAYFCKMRDRQIINMCDTAGIIVRKRWFTAVKGFSKDLNIGEDSYFATKVTGNGGEIFFDTKFSLTQYYDENETFLNHYKRTKNLASSYIKLFRKINKMNYISCEQFLLKSPSGCRKPIFYRILHFLLSLSLNLNLNRYRESLNSGRIDLTVRKTKI